MRSYWEIPALTVSVAWGASLLCLACLVAPFHRTTPEPADMPTIGWQHVESSVDGPLSRSSTVAPQYTPESPGHHSRYLMGRVAIEVKNPTQQPMVVEYEASFDRMENGTESENRMTEQYRRTLPPGVQAMELPFYLSPRESELRDEVVALTIKPHKEYTLGANHRHQITFRARPSTLKVEASHLTIREFESDSVEFIVKREEAMPTSQTVEYQLKGSAFENGAYSWDSNFRFLIPANSICSAPLIVRRKGRLERNREMTLVAADSSHVVQCFAAPAATFDAKVAAQLQEGKYATLTVFKKGGAIPPGESLDCSVMTSYDLQVDGDYTGTFNAVKDSLSFKILAKSDSMAFEDPTTATVSILIGNEKIERIISVIDTTPANLRITAPASPIVIKKGNKIPQVWTLSLHDNQTKAVTAATRQRIQFAIESVSADEMIASELQSEPAGTVKMGVLSGEVTIAGGRSETTLSLSSPSGQDKLQSDKEYRLEFLNDPSSRWKYDPEIERKFQFTVQDNRFPYSPLSPLSVTESDSPTKLRIFKVDRPLRRSDFIEFTIDDTSTATSVDYSIGLEAKAGVYRLQVNPDDEYVTLPIHAIADGILEDEKFLRLAIPGAKLPSPLSISIVDADRTGKALILVIANSRMGDRRLDSTKLTREVTSLQKLHGLKSSEQVIELVAGTVHIVDDTAESLYRSAKATPDLGRISPFAASFDDSTEPIEKAIRAWKNIAGYHPGIDVVFFVWLSDGKITRAPDQPVLNTFLKWDDRPKTDMHLIWLGGMTSTERFESKIAVPLEPLENAVIRLNDDSSSAAAIQKMIQKRHLKRVEQRDRDEATKHDARGGNNE